MPVSECVGPGWKKLVDPLKEVCKLTNTKILQVKEKFGGLRFYVDAAPEWLYDLICLAEGASTKTCEDCGAHDGYHKGFYSPEPSDGSDRFYKVTNGATEGTYWIRTLCTDCRAKSK